MRSGLASKRTRTRKRLSRKAGVLGSQSELNSSGAASGIPLFLKRAESHSNSPAPSSGSLGAEKLSQGRTLDSSTREFAESHLEKDLIDVRVHTGSDAAESAREFSARAYTVGRDIVFGAGEYAPGTAEGKKLLIHELTHVVQQQSMTGASTTAAGDASVSHPTDSLEHEASQTADSLVNSVTESRSSESSPAAQHQPAMTSAPVASGAMIQRQAIPGAPDITLRPSPMVARMLGSATLDGFAVDSATLTSQHRAQISELASSLVSLLRSYPSGSVSLIGHTDATGSEAHNTELGQKRADAVRAALIAAGVSSDVISATSAGESELRAQTEQADPRNRRVEVCFEPELRVHLVPSLELRLPTVEPAPATPPAPPVPSDTSLPPRPSPSQSLPKETPREAAQRILTPIPEARPGTSVSQAIFDRVDSGLNLVMRQLGIPESVRGIIRDGAHAAVNKAAESLLDSALAKAGITGQDAEAIRAAVHAAAQTPIR